MQPARYRKGGRVLFPVWPLRGSSSILPAISCSVNLSYHGRGLIFRVLRLSLPPVFQDFSYDDSKVEFNVDAPNGVVMEGYLFKRASNAFKTWNR